MRTYRSGNLDTCGLCSVKGRHKDLVSKRGKKRSFLYERAVAVKEILLHNLEKHSIPSLEKLTEKLDERFEDIGYEISATAHAQALDYAHLVRRYLLNEEKELVAVNLPPMDYRLDNGDVITVKPDAILREANPFGQITYYCIKYSCSSKHIEKTQWEPLLFAWYCEEFMRDMGQPILKGETIKAGYYFLRKGGDSNGEYSDGFFNTATTSCLITFNE